MWNYGFIIIMWQQWDKTAVDINEYFRLMLRLYFVLSLFKQKKVGLQKEDFT